MDTNEKIDAEAQAQLDFQSMTEAQIDRALGLCDRINCPVCGGKYHDESE